MTKGGREGRGEERRLMTKGGMEGEREQEGCGSW